MGRRQRARVAGLALLWSALVSVPSGGLHAASQTNAPAAPVTPVELSVVVEGLQRPWGLTFLPDGRMLFTEKPGRLRLVDGAGKGSPPLAGVPVVAAEGQGGLLDVAVAPDFATSGRVFLSFSEPRPEGGNGTSVWRARFVEDDKGARLEDGKVIFRQQPAWKSGYHFGSRIVFDKAGNLFVTLGERNFARAEAQNPANHIGKVVHITQDGEAAPGNPAQPGWDPLVWSIGHRNMQGAVVDPATGTLWTIEHGPKGGDELNVTEAGKNYGWPVITYGIDYSGAKMGEGEAKDGLEQPVYFWRPSIAVSGLALYSGDLFPGWKGNLLVGSLKTGLVQRLVLQDGKVVAVEEVGAGIGERVRDVRQGPDGAIYVITDENNGRILKLMPAK